MNTDPLTLTAEEKAKYWKILCAHVIDAGGCAGLGSKEYQHMGITIGKGSVGSLALKWLLKYAATDAKTPDEAAMFDAVLNTQVVRAAWKTDKGYYFEFWSEYLGIPFEKSHGQRVILLGYLKSLV